MKLEIPWEKSVFDISFLLKGRKGNTAAANYRTASIYVEDTYYDPESFSDRKQADYFFKPILQLAENRISARISDPKFAPDQACMRTLIISFLYRVEHES